MSIFSRLRKRGAEDGSPSEASPNPSTPPSPPAAAAAPSPRAPEPIRPAPPREPAVSRRARRFRSRRSAETSRPRPPGMIGAAPAPSPAAARPPLAVTKPAAAPSAPPPALPGMVSRANPQRAPSPERAAAPPPRPPRPRRRPPRRPPVAVNEPTGGSLDLAIALALDNEVPKANGVHKTNGVPKAAEAPSHLPPSAADEAALRATFEELAVAHVTVLRNAMLEVRWGEAQASWLELGRPALKSLRGMAAEVGHTALVAALDGFVVALQAVLEPGQPPEVTGPPARRCSPPTRRSPPACRARSRWKGSGIAASRSSFARCWSRWPTWNLSWSTS